ncbi:molybdopterin molybdotransferase MoeA [Gottschalkiaceae bacterium SANA]|nr:molybdopterin molybdotransferase MoeA [Gottschalkiaceae bacterium SANA]
MDLFTVMRRQEVATLLESEFLKWQQEQEWVSIEDALGRVLAADLVSEENIPPFRRSTVDGYAVRAADTTGCSDSLPAFLQMLGETRMGQGTDLEVQAEQAVYVPTGGIVPRGADAVCMIEYTENFQNEIAIQRPMSQLENLVEIGDDVSIGECVLQKGSRIQTQHIGAVAALGRNRVLVKKRIRVAILSTGDELIGPGKPLKLGQIRDSNTDALRAMVIALGCEVVIADRILDQFDALQSGLQKAISESDLVLISGGSSVGTLDMTPDIINSLGKPGILVHGIAIKPGKPTMVAKVQNKAVFGLPGHPASCLIAYKTIVEPFIQKTLLAERIKSFPLTAVADFQIHVSSGRDVFYMVQIQENEGRWIAKPVHGKSGMVSLLSKADGYIEIPMEKEGIQRGEIVSVHRF